MTQPTDEAAVEQLKPCPKCMGRSIGFMKDGEGETDVEGDLLFCVYCRDCDLTIGWLADLGLLETLWNAMADCAQLTAATRRAEQAERMLVEAEKSLTDAHKTLCWAGPRMRAKLSESEARTVDNCAVRMWVALTAIRSAASGEQG